MGLKELSRKGQIGVKARGLWNGPGYENIEDMEWEMKYTYDGTIQEN